MDTTISLLADFIVQGGLFAAGIVAAYYVSIRYC